MFSNSSRQALRRAQARAGAMVQVQAAPNTIQAVDFMDIIAGRAVTQANAITSQDAFSSQTDENEDITPRRPVVSRTPKTTRMRSSSVSMGTSGRVERGEKMGVLKTVQLHRRAKHTFAPLETLASAKERLLAADPVDSSSAPLRIRRNSTSEPLSPLLTPSADVPLEDVEELPKAKASAGKEGHPPSPTPGAPTPSSSSSDFVQLFGRLEKLGDENVVADTVRHLLKKPKVKVKEFNAALHALATTRLAGHPIQSIIQLYNTMLSQSVVPNVQTYETLIGALLTRDEEVRKAIVTLEMRPKQVPLVGRMEVASMEADQDRIAKLKEEQNFSTALSLFEGVLAVGGREKLAHSTYVKLLSACAGHTDVDAAIHIFAQLEAIKDMKIGINVYEYLILTFSNAKKIEEAEHIFEAFLTASRSGKLRRYPLPMADAERRAQIMVWNVMIEAYFRAEMPDKAIELVERMVNSTAGDRFTPQDIPIATSSTFTTVIAGFLLGGDLQSALAWFNQLLTQAKTPSSPFEGLGGKAMRPDSVAWHLVLDALAAEGNLQELNRLYTIYRSVSKEDSLHTRQIDHVLIHRANMDNLDKLDEQTALQTLQFLLDDLVEYEPVQEKLEMKTNICKAFVSRGDFETACAVMTTSILEQFQADYDGSLAHVLQWLRNTSKDFIDHVTTTLVNRNGELPFLSALALARMGENLALPKQLSFAPHILHAYGRARFQNLIPYSELSVNDWETLLSYAAYLEANVVNGNPENLPPIPGYAFNGLVSLLDDLSTQKIEFSIFKLDTQRKTLDVLGRLYPDPKARQQFLVKLGPSYESAGKQFDRLNLAALENALKELPNPSIERMESTTMPVTSESENSHLRIDRYQTKVIETAAFKRVGRRYEFDVIKGYQAFSQGVEKGVVPMPHTFSRLIEGLGRAKETEKVAELYQIAQAVLPSIEEKSKFASWVSIENSMIIALGHSENLEAAHNHRLRILEAGGSPSADGYGVLIQHVKDTTDDASAALSLFNEAIAHGVQPNLYLYNNIISKLSKARKADYAIELFQQMKASGIHPSSITYGAVIGACARVGDVLSAESLFTEMTQAPDFKPRVPPYNTMMQLYTTTKPIRNSVLFFREEMRRAGVKPSSHTYKLLMDAYGSIEPIDLAKMEATFAQLQKHTEVPITGAHFASLINAYGCVNKDLDKAISIFETMHKVPRAPAPDAVVFEALINAIVAHKRTDLIPVYVSKMSESGVHMTAYIANFLIKGYANVNDMNQARAVFESLLDPPTGVAAPNNHAPHDSNTPGVPVMEPVYREPSTWEVMVRAELGCGNRRGALALLERLRERQYPEAVYNRISGVLTDHSVPL
uniref:Pentacotripeptide-repeat region of PRORP domain-containing protein n=1 Tax=Psilocybe cubensis TaxID=181762 RepID=A0A8H8CLR2_PSICU